MPFVDDTYEKQTASPRALPPATPTSGSNANPQGAAKSPTGIAGDSVYEGDMAVAKKAYDDALADINYQRGSTQLGTGFNADGTPIANSHGAYQQMREGQGLDLEHVINMARTRGITGGIANRGEQQMRFQQRGQTDDFFRGYQDQLHGFDVGEAGALNNFNQGKNSAMAALIARKLAAQAATPPSVTSPTTSPLGSGVKILKGWTDPTTLRKYGAPDPWAISLVNKNRKR